MTYIDIISARRQVIAYIEIRRLPRAAASQRASAAHKRVVYKILPQRQLAGVYLPMNEDAPLAARSRWSARTLIKLADKSICGLLDVSIFR